MVYLTNAFSLQMIQLDKESKVTITPVTMEEVKTAIDIGFTSAIGHPDTATVLTDILGCPVASNRISIKLMPTDVLYVAQLTGGRLPEGSTQLPEGYSFAFVKITVA